LLAFASWVLLLLFLWQTSCSIRVYKFRLFWPESEKNFDDKNIFDQKRQNQLFVQDKMFQREAVAVDNIQQ